MEFFPAWAKVNLGLDVRERRSDGYHNVCMVMQTVSLADTVGLEPQAAGIVLEVRGASLPSGEENLAYRAAQLVGTRYKVPGGFRMILEKRIPVAAGLAGGSADAAAVLYGLNRVWELGLSERELEELALELGSDVPFSLRGGTALAEGRGEVLTSLPPLPDCWLVLARPDFGVSTAWAYKELDADPPETRPDIAGLVAAVRAGDLVGIASRLGNSFETVVTARYPVVGELKAALLKAGALGASLSGSGPTVFGLFAARAQAEAAAKNLPSGVEAFIVRPVAAGAGAGGEGAVGRP